MSRFVLDPVKVRRIRKAAKLRDRLTNKSLAAVHGCSEGAIRNVLKGSRWGHVK